MGKKPAATSIIEEALRQRLTLGKRRSFFTVIEGAKDAQDAFFQVGANVSLRSAASLAAKFVALRSEAPTTYTAVRTSLTTKGGSAMGKVAMAIAACFLIIGSIGGMACKQAWEDKPTAAPAPTAAAVEVQYLGIVGRPYYFDGTVGLEVASDDTRTFFVTENAFEPKNQTGTVYLLATLATQDENGTVTNTELSPMAATVKGDGYEVTVSASQIPDGVELDKIRFVKKDVNGLEIAEARLQSETTPFGGSSISVAFWKGNVLFSGSNWNPGMPATLDDTIFGDMFVAVVKVTRNLSGKAIYAISIRTGGKMVRMSMNRITSTGLEFMLEKMWTSSEANKNGWTPFVTLHDLAGSEELVDGRYAALLSEFEPNPNISGEFRKKADFDTSKSIFSGDIAVAGTTKKGLVLNFQDGLVFDGPAATIQNTDLKAIVVRPNDVTLTKPDTKKVNRTIGTFDMAGKKYRLSLGSRPAFLALAWKSDNEAIATVDTSTGTIASVNPNTAAAGVYLEGGAVKSNKIQVSVVGRFKDYDLTWSQPEVLSGKTVDLVLTVHFYDADDRSETPDDVEALTPEIGTITGKTKGLGRDEGTARYRVTHRGVVEEIELPVKAWAAGILVSLSKSPISVGESGDATATVDWRGRKDEPATMSVNWKASKTSVEFKTVDPNVTYNGAAEDTVSVTAEHKTYKDPTDPTKPLSSTPINLSVQPKIYDSDGLTATKMTLGPNEEVELHLFTELQGAAPADKAYDAIYSTSNSGVEIVKNDTSKTVKVKADGVDATTIVTAQLLGRTFQLTFKVEVALDPAASLVVTFANGVSSIAENGGQVAYTAEAVYVGGGKRNVTVASATVPTPASVTEPSGKVTAAAGVLTGANDGSGDVTLTFSYVEKGVTQTATKTLTVAPKGVAIKVYQGTTLLTDTSVVQVTSGSPVGLTLKEGKSDNTEEDLSGFTTEVSDNPAFDKAESANTLTLSRKAGQSGQGTVTVKKPGFADFVITIDVIADEKLIASVTTFSLLTGGSATTFTVQEEVTPNPAQVATGISVETTGPVTASVTDPATGTVTVTPSPDTSGPATVTIKKSGFPNKTVSGTVTAQELVLLGPAGGITLLAASGQAATSLVGLVKVDLNDQSPDRALSAAEIEIVSITPSDGSIFTADATAKTLLGVTASGTTAASIKVGKVGSTMAPIDIAVTVTANPVSAQMTGPALPAGQSFLLARVGEAAIQFSAEVTNSDGTKATTASLFDWTGADANGLLTLPATAGIIMVKATVKNTTPTISTGEIEIRVVDNHGILTSMFYILEGEYKAPLAGIGLTLPVDQAPIIRYSPSWAEQTMTLVSTVGGTKYAIYQATGIAAGTVVDWVVTSSGPEPKMYVPNATNTFADQVENGVGGRQFQVTAR